MYLVKWIQHFCVSVPTTIEGLLSSPLFHLRLLINVFYFLSCFVVCLFNFHYQTKLVLFSHRLKAILPIRMKLKLKKNHLTSPQSSLTVKWLAIDVTLTKIIAHGVGTNGVRATNSDDRICKYALIHRIYTMQKWVHVKMKIKRFWFTPVSKKLSTPNKAKYKS